MSLSSEIAAIADEVGKSTSTVVKSRNRHREVTSKLANISQRLRALSQNAKDILKLGDVNASVLEEFGALVEKGHVVIPDDDDESHKSYTRGLLKSIPMCVKAYYDCAGRDFEDESSASI